MLQKFNEHLQGLLAWIIVGLVAITFAIFGLDYLFQGKQATHSIVSVNGQAISQATFDHLYQQVQQQDKTLSSPEDPVIKNQILEELIIRTLALQSAKKAGFMVTADQVKTAILQIPQFQEDGHFSPERYQQVLMATMYTPETLAQEVQHGMILNQQRFGLIGSAFVLPQDLIQYAKLLFETRTYEYLILPWMRFISKMPISQEAIAGYYEKHLQLFKSPPLVRLAYLEVSLEKIKTTIHVSDSDMQSYPTTDHTPSALSALQKQIVNEKAERHYATLIEQLTELAYEYPDSLTHVSKTLKLPILYTEFFSQQGGSSPMTKNPLVMKAAFSEEVLTLGNNSEPIQLDPSRVVVVRVAEQKSAYVKSLKTVTSQIIQILRFNAAKAKARKTGLEVLAGHSVPPGFHWKTEVDLSRDLETTYPQIRDQAFEFKKVGEQGDVVLPNGDVALVKLKAVHPGDWSTLDAEQKNSLSQQVGAAFGALDYDLFVRSLVDSAKIKR